MEILDMPIEDLYFSSAAMRHLKRGNFKTLKDIISKTESEIAYSMNKKSFIELVEIMKRYNLRFKPLFD